MPKVGSVQGSQASTETGIHIVLISRRQQVLGSDLFTGLGIDIEKLSGLVVKSMHHFRHSFGEVTGDIVYVGTPGLLRTDLENLPFERRSNDFWPRVPA